MAGSGAAGFGGGFASGLSQVLLGQRTREDKKRADEEARKDRLFQTMLPIYLENVESPADLESLFQDRFPDLMKGKGKKGQPGAFDTISHFLSPLIGQKKQQMASGAVGAAQQTDQATAAPTQAEQMIWPAAGGELQPAPAVVDPQAAAMIGQPVVPAATVPTAAVAPPSAVAPTTATPTPTAPARRTLMGVPLMSEDERIERDITKQTKISTALMERARTTILPALRSMDPKATMQDALRVLGINIPRDYASSAAANQSIAGEMADGTPAFGVFNRSTGAYNDPETGEPLVGFRPRTTTGSSSSGADRDAIAQAEFGKKFAFLTQTQQQRVQDLLPAFAEKMAERRGTGTGRAKIQTELDSPIGPTAATLYPGASAATTLRQLGAENPLTATQQEKVASLGQVDQLLDEIGEALPKVFPEVEAGIWGRLQTQFALGTKKLAADEDLATLDASIKAALAQVAQLSGQPGSRLSDRDVEMAQATLAELKPQLFGGDTLRTAQARLGVVRRLLEKAQSAVPKPTGPTGAKPAGTAGATGAAAPKTGNAVIKNGKLFIDGVEIGAP